MGVSDAAPAIATMRLPHTLDLVGAERLADLLRSNLDHGRAILIDAAAVERVGTPCIQLLVAASRTACLSGVDFQIIASSEAFRDSVSDLGLGHELQVKSKEKP